MYNYQTERPGLFSPEGFKLITKIRAKAQKCIELSGAARMDKLIQGCTGDSWQMMAAVDYLVEEGELVRITPADTVWGQYQIFTEPRHG